jgi:hypothetical protein
MKERDREEHDFGRAARSAVTWKSGASAPRKVHNFGENKSGWNMPTSPTSEPLLPSRALAPDAAGPLHL